MTVSRLLIVADMLMRVNVAEGGRRMQTMLSALPLALAECAHELKQTLRHNASATSKGEYKAKYKASAKVERKAWRKACAREQRKDCAKAGLVNGT